MKKIQKVKLRCKNLRENWEIFVFIHFIVLIFLRVFATNNEIYLKENSIIFGIYTFLFIILISRDWYLYWLRKNCNHINSTKIGCISCGKKFKNGKISK